MRFVVEMDVELAIEAFKEVPSGTVSPFCTDSEEAARRVDGQASRPPGTSCGC